MSVATFALHPEATADPQVIRWIVPAGTLQVLGAVSDAPGDLGTMLRAGTLASIDVHTAGIDIALPVGQGWREHGEPVRTALLQALSVPAQWDAQQPVTADDELRTAVLQVLEGGAGDYIRSHGGKAEIISVHEGHVEIRLSGTCSHCPAAGFTLHERLEVAIRELAPGLRELRATQTPRAAGKVFMKLGLRRPS
ncbi:MAG: NifU family protein [Actinomycetota bacterium]|nr:NifU family protein [Actinomycetota bacterium]